MCKLCEKKIDKIPGMTLTLFEAVHNIGKCPAMAALEHLTPGGSEYWEDPQRCADMIRENRDNLWELLKKETIERKRLQEKA